jgi:hypothetical protein
MFTQAEYINGWLVYCGGALIGLGCWWYLLKKLPLGPLRPPLLGAMIGLLFMPWQTDIDSGFFAPAWLIAGSEGFFEQADAFWRAGTPMLVAVAAGLILVTGLQLARHILRRNDS